MSINTCPVATIDVPVALVWSLLADPRRYDLWWDAQTHSIVPEGPAQPGQQIVARTFALGKQWDVHATVQALTPEKHQLDLFTRLPLGITVHNRITCTPLDAQHTRVSFG
jgi:hypothetical protein